MLLDKHRLLMLKAAYLAQFDWLDLAVCVLCLVGYMMGYHDSVVEYI